MKPLVSRITKIALLTSLLSLTGCAAIGTSISHGSLQTQTLMSDSIFMNPTTNNTVKTIYVEIHNTTDKAHFDITTPLLDRLHNKGYKISQNPNTAHYILQVNLLQMGRNSMAAAKEQMGFGYGGALEGGIAAGAVASAASASALTMTGVGIAGAAAGSVIDNAVQDITYSGIVDVQVTERSMHHKKIYKTRILTTADKVNLSFNQAAPSLENGLAQSISGLFN